jgi:alkylated DNA repair protein (DNA oxidative demethylase)
MPHQPIDDLFADDSAQPTALPLGTQALLLRGFALAQADALVQGVQQVAAQAPCHMLTPGGRPCRWP